MTDHQRFDSIYEVQCGREVTPNLNKLADSGAFFTRAYNVCPLCVPARTSLATGIYPTQNGIVYNDWKGLHAGSYPTIYELLKQADYQVGHVGVDHINTTKPLSDLGLDHYKSQGDYNAWAKAQGLLVSYVELYQLFWAKRRNAVTAIQGSASGRILPRPTRILISWRNL